MLFKGHVATMKAHKISKETPNWKSLGKRVSGKPGTAGQQTIKKDSGELVDINWEEK